MLARLLKSLSLKLKQMLMRMFIGCLLTNIFVLFRYSICPPLAETRLLVVKRMIFGFFLMGSIYFLSIFSVCTLYNSLMLDVYRFCMGFKLFKIIRVSTWEQHPKYGIFCLNLILIDFLVRFFITFPAYHFQKDLTYL